MLKYINKDKKGFTLVELVVVIAILAILAAVAIPSVLGIINSANESAAQSNAAALDAACKNLYAGVTGGSINATDNGPLAASKLPAKNDSVTNKKTKAGNLKIEDAITYSGLTSSITSNVIADFKYSSKDGTIAYNNGSLGTEFTGTVTMGTTLSTLYKNNTTTTPAPAGT